MAGTDGAASNHLIEDLAAQPWSYDFFHAVRLLENQARHLPRCGWSVKPTDDPVRFGQQPSLAFPASTVEAFHPGPPARLFVRHFGLFGPNGAVPLNWTEYAFKRQNHRSDHTFTAFVNVLQHRLYSFFYRAWAAGQKTVDADRSRPPQGADSAAGPDPAVQAGDEERFAVYLGSLSGIGQEALQNADSVPDYAKLYYSGRLVTPQRNAEGLEAILGDFFGLRCEVQQFAGAWLNLPPGCECRLGKSPDTGRLGVNTIVGARLWDCQLNFCVRLGPTTLADFERVLPGSRSFARLKDWVRNYCGEHYSWRLQLVLARDEVPALQLGRTARLGWTTWLKTKPFTHDAEDLILSPDALETN